MAKIERFMELFEILYNKSNELNDEEYSKYYDSVEIMLDEMDTLWYGFTEEEFEIVENRVDMLVINNLLKEKTNGSNNN